MVQSQRRGPPKGLFEALEALNGDGFVLPRPKFPNPPPLLGPPENGLGFVDCPKPAPPNGVLLLPNPEVPPPTPPTPGIS